MNLDIPHVIFIVGFIFGLIVLGLVFLDKIDLYTKGRPLLILCVGLPLFLDGIYMQIYLDSDKPYYVWIMGLLISSLGLFALLYRRK